MKRKVKHLWTRSLKATLATKPVRYSGQLERKKTTGHGNGKKEQKCKWQGRIAKKFPFLLAGPAFTGNPLNHPSIRDANPFL
jgi:hypothetical protein